MKRIAPVLLCAALLCTPLLAPAPASAQSAPAAGNTTQTANVSTINATDTIATNGQATCLITTSGTWTGTMSTEGLDYNGATVAVSSTSVPGGTAGTTFTTNGAYSANVAGFTAFRVRASAWTSGTALVTITCTPASSSSGSGGGGGGGGAVTQSTGSSSTPWYVQVCDKTTNGQCASVDANGRQASRVCDNTTSTQCIGVDANGVAKTKNCDATTSTQCAGVTTSGALQTASQNNPCQSGTLHYVSINTVTQAATQLVALSGSTVIYGCGLLINAAGATNLIFNYGTGTNCATGIGQTGMPGGSNGMPFVANQGFTWNGTLPLFATPAGNALCPSESNGVQLSGTLIYVQQ